MSSWELALIVLSEIGIGTIITKQFMKKAESMEVLFKRVCEFLDDIKENYKDKTILLATYSGVTKVINVILMVCLKMKIYKFLD